MGNYIFYTPRDLAELLLQFVPRQKQIHSITDICCGSWNLLSAAKKNDILTPKSWVLTLTKQWLKTACQMQSSYIVMEENMPIVRSLKIIRLT